MTPDQSELIRTMDNVQFTHFVWILVVGFILSTFASFLLSYFVKRGELKAIQETLETVTRNIEDVKNRSSMISNNMTHLHIRRIDTIITFANWLQTMSRLVHNKEMGKTVINMSKQIEEMQEQSAIMDLLVPSYKMNVHLDEILEVIGAMSVETNNWIANSKINDPEATRKYNEAMSPTRARFETAHAGLLSILKEQLNIEFHTN